MKLILLTFLAFLSGLTYGCFRENMPEPVVVHIFRDPTATQIDSALRSAGEMHLKTTDSKSILIATMEVTSYQDGLAMLGRNAHPEVVCVASREDGVKAKIDIPPGSAVEISGRQFFLVVPSWASGEKREAAKLVVAAVRRELQKAEVQD